MTFTARPVAPFSIDILSAGDPSSFADDQKIPCTGTPGQTRATISSGQITVYAGSHWRLEYSPCFTTSPWEVQFYSVTDEDYIGQSCLGSGPPPHSSNHARKGRPTACALILNSDISTSKVIEVRIVSAGSMGSRVSATYSKGFGNASFRIMELPI